MAKGSIHIRACNVAQSEQHNKREKDLDYIRKDLTPQNESYFFEAVPTPLAKLKKQIAKEVKTKTGRAMQKNAVPIQEAVTVIEDKSTMEDLIKFCRKVQDRWGVIPLQIHIHRDEGHMRSAAVREWRKDPSNPWKPNLHAHIVWRSVKKDGKSVRLTKADCEEMQTIYAEVMGMERGRRTGRKGLSAMDFKLQAKERELQELLDLTKSQGNTIAEQQKSIDSLVAEVSKLKTDKGKAEAALKKARGEADKAKQDRMDAEKEARGAELRKNEAEAKTSLAEARMKEAEQRADEATAALASLQKDIDAGEERKTAQGRALLIMEQDATALAKARTNTWEAIEAIGTGGLFTSSNTKKQREALKREAIDSLKDWSIKTQLANDAKRQQERLSAAENKVRSAESMLQTQSMTDKDLRALHPDEAQKLDEMNELQLDANERRQLLYGHAIKVSKKWYDRERNKFTDTIEAEVSMDGNHVRLNKGEIKAFFADFWAKVARATHAANEAFKKRFGLKSNAVSMTMQRNYQGYFISGDVGGTPLETKRLTDESGQSIERGLKQVSLMEEMAFRLKFLGSVYTSEELQRADRGECVERKEINRSQGMRR